MATSPLSSVLSPAQIAVVQQARALVARPRLPATPQAQPNDAGVGPAQRANQSASPRGRGAIINITV